MVETINLWEAIRQIRILSSKGIYFSIVHACYNKERREAKGKRLVRKCILRPSAKGDDVKWANHKLFYTDLNLNGENANRNCWQVLILYFNGKKCVL